MRPRSVPDGLFACRHEMVRRLLEHDPSPIAAESLHCATLPTARKWLCLHLADHEAELMKNLVKPEGRPACHASAAHAVSPYRGQCGSFGGNCRPSAGACTDVKACVCGATGCATNVCRGNVLSAHKRPGGPSSSLASRGAYVKGGALAMHRGNALVCPPLGGACAATRCPAPTGMMCQSADANPTVQQELSCPEVLARSRRSSWLRGRT